MRDEKVWQQLERTLQVEVEAFAGVAGIALLDLKKDRLLAINGDEQFPTASSIKIHLLAALEQLHYEGRINLDERVVPSCEVAGSGVLAYLDDGIELTWRDVANLMIIVSDNTATNMVIELIGYDVMADFMEQWGLEQTVLQRKMQEYEAVAEERENLGTPREFVKVMELLHDGSAFGDGVAEECLRILKKPKRTLFEPAVPPELELANKPGGMEHVRCDVGLFYLAKRPFILAVMTKFCRLEPTVQEAWIGEVAREVFDVFHLLDKTSGYGQGVPAEYR